MARLGPRAILAYIGVVFAGVVYINVFPPIIEPIVSFAEGYGPVGNYGMGGVPEAVLTSTLVIGPLIVIGGLTVWILLVAVSESGLLGAR